MKAQPLFSANFLSHYLPEFKASSVNDIRGITILIKSLVHEFESGKLESLKEEEIKSRFVNTFFGDILGFNYGNSKRWQLREEVKATLDGKKPDAALGYFTKDKKENDVRAVIEIKDAKINLDEKQKRDNNQTPVEQAFGYAYKMGGNCKWVIVSNMKETRFYSSNDYSKYQIFNLAELTEEKKRNELLFLFHKDRFIKENGSSTTDLLFRKAKKVQPENDAAIHIIDRLYNCVKRFDGLGFIDPDYISKIYPFNILKEHVWHYYNRNLFTINSELYDLINKLRIENKEVVFSNELIKEIETNNIVDAKHKVEIVFKFLNQCLIEEISAIKDYKLVAQRNKNVLGFSYRHHFHFKEEVDGITKGIDLLIHKECDCLICNYRSLDFNKFLRKLKSGFGNDDCNTLEYAFANYLAASNDFKTSYQIYKSLEKELKEKEESETEYFLTKLNIKYLHNLISDYRYDDSAEILDNIKSIDLDKVIYDEIEFSVDKDVKDYLIKIKEEAFIFKLQDKIEEITSEIEKLKHLYERGGKQHSGPNLPNQLFQTFLMLYSYINRNYIIYDTFTRYKSLTEKIFRGFIQSYNLPEYGITSFNEFILLETILNISPKELQDILKKVDNIKTDEDCVLNLIQKLFNFTSSYCKNGLFNTPYKNPLLEEQLLNFRFRIRFSDIFTNLFTILSRLDISKEQFDKSKKHIINFLELEDELAWHNIQEFGDFIKRKGFLFTSQELIEILQIGIERHKYGQCKYTSFVKQVAQGLSKYYPNDKIQNTKLIKTALLKCSSDDGTNANYGDIVYLMNICDNKCKNILTNTIENYLEDNFDDRLYEKLLRSKSYNYKSKSFFLTYCKQIQKNTYYDFGKHKLSTHPFINFMIVLQLLNIELTETEVQIFKNRSVFEQWLLNPAQFNYNIFDPNWLIEIKEYIILDKIRGVKEVEKAIEKELKKKFNPVLAEIKYKYFYNELK